MKYLNQTLYPLCVLQSILYFNFEYLIMKPLQNSLSVKAKSIRKDSSEMIIETFWELISISLCSFMFYLMASKMSIIT